MAPGHYECHWRIEPAFLPELVQCTAWPLRAGPGGRGTRVTFEGQIGIGTNSGARLPAYLDSAC